MLTIYKRGGRISKKRAPYSAACASSNAGMIGNTIVDIWSAEGVRPVLKYEDDIAIIRCPDPKGQHVEGVYRYKYNRDDALHIIAPLKVPWHPEKGTTSFSPHLLFIGLSWDLETRQVSLPDNKHLKFLAQVDSFVGQFSRGRCALNNVQKLRGSLCYISFVYTDGRSRLPSLSNFMARFKGNEYTCLYPPPSLITDLKWWSARLTTTGVFCQLSPRGPLLNMGIFVDASTSWGIGIVIDGQWIGFQLAPCWKVPSRDITWLETIAVEILAYFLDSLNVNNRNVLIHSNNQGTIGAMDKGRSPNVHINLSVRWTYATLSAILAVPTFVYIPSADNPADPISHGETGPPSSRLHTAFMLPPELQDIFINAC